MKREILGVFLSILLASSAGAAITFDSSASANGLTTISWSHTVGNGSDRMLVVGVSSGLGGASTVTYGGQPLSRQIILSGGGGIPVSEIWTMTAPPVGTATVTVTLSAVGDGVGGSASYFGVNQATPIRGFNSNSASSIQPTNVSTSVTTVVGDMVVDNVAAFQASASRTPGAGQTITWDAGLGGPSISGSGSRKTGAAGSTTMSWTLASLSPAAVISTGLVAISLIPAPTADLSITKSGPASATAGTDITYSITATNNGPDDAQGVLISDPMPAGTTFVSVTPLTGPVSICSTPAVGTNGQIDCAISTLPSGQSATYSFVFHIAPNLATGTQITNAVSISGVTADPNTGNNDSSATTTVTASANLGVTKSGPASIVAGSNISYNINVTNGGPSDAQTVTLSDPLPAGTTFVSLSSPGGWSCTTPAVGGTGTVTCSIATFATGASAPFTLTLAVTTGATSPLVNTATVASATPDPTPGNESATATTVVAPFNSVPALDWRALAALMVVLAVVGGIRLRA